MPPDSIAAHSLPCRTAAQANLVHRGTTRNPAGIPRRAARRNAKELAMIVTEFRTTGLGGVVVHYRVDGKG